MASSRIGLNGGIAAVTASMGVAVASGPTNADELYRVADRALYEAKRLGRDRGVIGASHRSSPPARHKVGPLPWRTKG